MKKQNLTQRIIFHPINRKITSNSLAEKTICTSKKAIHIGKTTAIRIKENHKQAAKHGIKLKIYETLITSLIFGTYTTIPFFQQPKKNQEDNNSPANSIYLLKDNSREEMDKYLEEIYKRFNCE